jgi:hypothetical protein
MSAEHAQAAPTPNLDVSAAQEFAERDQEQIDSERKRKIELFRQRVRSAITRKVVQKAIFTSKSSQIPVIDHFFLFL